MRRWHFWLALSLSLGVLVALGCNRSTPAPQPQKPAPEAQKPAPEVRPAPQPQQQTPRTYSSPPPLTIDPNKSYTATVQTNRGDFTIQLFAAEAPQTVNNFVFLAREGYYDGAPFHRVVRDFMVQTGDPTGTGRGGPGYNVPDELPAKHPYDPGIVAMANTGRPNSGGSQFFVCTGPVCQALQAQPTYTQFGQVTRGMEVVQQIAAVPVGPSPTGEPSKPKEAVFIKTITIQEG